MTTKEIRRVVITGMGTVNPIGNSVAESWEAAKAGTCGIGPITLFDTENHQVKIAGEVKGLDINAHIPKKESRKMDRFTQLAMIAAAEAMENSGLDMEKEHASRCGVMVASGIGGLGTIAEQEDRGVAKGFDRVSPFFVPMSIINMAAGQIAIAYGLKGMCSSVVTACASANNAIGDSFRQIRDGYIDVMVTGGTESCITPLGIGGFTSMKALTKESDPSRASIPFDADRSGFVMGEGAGILVLEERQHALDRGAVIYGEVVGYGATCDAYHITAPDPTGAGGASAMAMAVADAGIALEDVGYINAHGTSTPLNDAGETAAVNTVFGSHARKLLMSSTKSMTGHLLGASGAIEAIFTVKALEDQFVPPTIGYKNPDPACDLDCVPNEGRPAAITYALSNNLGFGGHNAVVLFKKGDA